MPLFEGKSLFQLTWKRFCEYGYRENLICITPEEQKEFVQGFPAILEPGMRNTGPAALFAAKHFEINDRCLLVPCDQMLGDETAFFSQLDLEKPRLTIFGQECKEFDSSFGYFLTEGERVTQFVEKPQVRPEGDLYRNSGLFLFTPKLLAEESQLARDFFAGNMSYEQLPKLSIDQMILERSHQLYFQPLGTSFVDLGTLDRLHGFLGKEPVDSHCRNEQECAIGKA